MTLRSGALPNLKPAVPLWGGRNTKVRTVTVTWNLRVPSPPQWESHWQMPTPSRTAGKISHGPCALQLEVPGLRGTSHNLSLSVDSAHLARLEVSLLAVLSVCVCVREGLALTGGCHMMIMISLLQ